jgi:hypothetical protein
MTPIGTLPGDTEGSQTEMGDTRGETLAHGSHRNLHLPRPGQCGEPAKILVFDPGRDLRVEASDPFEKGGGDLGPDPRLLTTHDYQTLGGHPCLPGRFGGDPSPSVEDDHRGYQRRLGEETETETGQTGAGDTEQLGDMAGTETEITLFSVLQHERRGLQRNTVDAHLLTPVGHSIISNVCSRASCHLLGSPPT